MITTAINQTDGYKIDHRSQYPKKTEVVVSNWTPRSVAHSEKILINETIPGFENINNEIVVFGYTYFIKWFLMQEFQRTFFDVPKEQAVKAYKRRIQNYLGPDAITFEHIEALHDLGYLPITIKALPEGSVVPVRVPYLVIYNTLPEFFWVTNFLETIMSCMLWKPANSATTARKYRVLLDYYAELTGGAPEFVKFQGHDFSFRGMSGLQDAQMSGAGHLLSFVGTDTLPAIDFLEQYYNADSDKELVGVSVPATEHSVMSLNGHESEIETFRRLLTEIYPTGIVSVVSDTWDFWKVVTEYVPMLKDIIVSRNGKLVLRPDSGDPVKIVAGDPNAPKDSPEYKGVIECLWETFGGTVNTKGYKELLGCIGVIYGDSITLTRADAICRRLMEKGFASTNVVLGVGSFTYEYCTRDTLGFAMKATAGIVDGEFREIYKDPKTDPGSMKKSAKGLIRVFNDGNTYGYQDCVSPDTFFGEENELKTVFSNGKLLYNPSLCEIRDRLWS